jgi:hypothetical protein
MSTAGVDNWAIGIPTLSTADWVLFNYATNSSNLSFASSTGAATFSSVVGANIAPLANYGLSTKGLYGLWIQRNSVNDSGVEIYHDGSNTIINSTYQSTGAFGGILLYTGGAIRLTITSAGAANFSNSLRIQGSTVPASGAGTELAWDGTNGYLLAYNRTTSAYLPLSILGSSLSFTGAATFSSTLQANGNAFILPTLSGGGAGGGLYLGVYPDTQYTKQAILVERYASTLGNYGRGSLHFCNRDTADTNQPTLADSRMVITSDGFVGINTTSPGSYRLYVNGASYLDGYNYASSIQYTRAPSNTVAPASGNGILVFAGGNAQMRMDTANQICFDMNNAGNPFTVLTLKQSDNTVSINSPNNSLPLELKYQNVASGYLGASGSALYAYSTNGGYVLLNASSVWVAASDVKRKRNFENYNLGLDSILGLKPKLYNMDFQEDGDEKQVGLVAQEVRDFIPHAYEENADFIGLNYNAIIVTMVKAIQELKTEIDSLKNL